MHTRACTAGLRPKQTCSTISKSAHLQSIKWCLRSNAQGSSGDSRASLAASRCLSIRNIYRIYTDPASTSQNLRVEVLGQRFQRLGVVVEGHARILGRSSRGQDTNGAPLANQATYK